MVLCYLYENKKFKYIYINCFITILIYTKIKSERSQVLALEDTIIL